MSLTMTTGTTAATVFYALLAILCITSNSLVCYLITKRKILHHVLKYYILSLAFTDLFVGIFLIPLYTCILTDFVPKGSSYSIYQRIYTGLDIMLGASSIFHLCLMSIDRAIAIINPLLHRAYMKDKSFVLKLLILPWAMALACAIPKFARLYYPFYSVITPIVTFAVPTLVIIICYACIFTTVRRRNITNNIRRRNIANSIRLVNEKKLIRTVMCVIIVFIVCWAPFHVFNIIYGLNTLTLNKKKIDIILRVFKWMQYFNSACNPFIYAIFHPNFRSAMKIITKNCCNCKEEVVDKNRTQGLNNQSYDTKL